MKKWALLLALLLVGCGPKLDSEDWRQRVKAVEKLSDAETLLEIAVGDQDLEVRAAVLKRLDHLNLDTGFAASILGYVSEVPDEHRHRIAAELILLLPHLEAQSLKRETGDLVFFEVEWKKTWESYKNLGAPGSFTLNGERVSVWIELEFLPEAIRAGWDTEFQRTAMSRDPDDRFLAASVNHRDLLDGLFDHLSLAALEGIARSARSQDIRSLAQLEADAIHKDLNHDNSSIRREAVTRLEGSRMLDTIAVKDENYMVRATAIELLDDLILLQRIIWEEKDKFALRLAKERFAVIEDRKERTAEELQEEKRQAMKEIREKKRQDYQEAMERFIGSSPPEA